MQLVLSIVLATIPSLPIAAQTAKVKFVSDGDSFGIENGERVRMIGINAPELANKFGPESKEHLARLIRGKVVTLERDPENDDRDIHGRLLRFVSVNGIDINRQMIADGYAHAFLRYRFSNKRRETYRQAEAAARKARLGLWALPTGDGELTQDPATESTIQPVRTPDAEIRRTSWCSTAGLVVLAFALGFRSRRRKSDDWASSSNPCKNLQS